MTQAADIEVGGTSTSSSTSPAAETTGSVTIKPDPGIDTQEMARFLGMVFGKTTDSYVQICAFTYEGNDKPRPSHFVMGGELVNDKGETYEATPQVVAEMVAQADKDGILGPYPGRTELETVSGWYIRMTTMAAMPATRHERGGARLTRQVIGFWADGDYGEKGHRRKPGQLPNPPDADAVREVWKRAGYPEPSVTWMTGGGIDGLWMFPEPITIPEGTEGEELYAKLSSASKRWGGHLARTARALGYHHDTGGDLSRVLRLPGSVNRKADHAYDPKAVHADYTGATYELDELAAMLPHDSRPERVKPIQSFDGPKTGDTPWDAYNAYMWAEGRFRQQLSSDGWQHHSWSGQVENLTHPNKPFSEGQSATFGHNEDTDQPKLYSFSSSAPGLVGVDKEDGGFRDQYLDPYTYLAATQFHANEETGELHTGREAMSQCAKRLRRSGFAAPTIEELGYSEVAVPEQRTASENTVSAPSAPVASSGDEDDDEPDGQRYMALRDELARRQAIITANQIEAAKALKDPSYRPSWEVRAYEQILGREQAQKRRAEELRVEEPEDDFGDIFDLIASGDTTDRRPVFGYLCDDSCGLFYEGTTNGVYGKSGIGKSIMQARLQVEAMRNGKNVLHWEFDNNANQVIIRRLVDAGVTREQLTTQFKVVRSVEELEHKVTEGFKENIGLVTLDALTPAISALGGEVNHPSGTDLVLRTLMQPFTVRGAVGFFLGHVGHDNQDRMAGSNRMFAAVQGALYNAEVVVKPSIGIKGLVKLILKKDNQGYAGEADKLAAYVTYDSTKGDGSVMTVFSRERDVRDVQAELEALEQKKTEHATRTAEQDIQIIWNALSKTGDALSINDLYVLLKNRGEPFTDRQLRTRLEKMLADKLVLIDPVASQRPAASSGGRPSKRFRAVAAPSS
ncbi:hypothetical protein [Streptomyces sp. NPDC047869]|uniref:hypothetical protein n=1 Tax=Streptomyces sp. NPDC047869 TaxID=3154709 RepID=UPI003452328A